MSIHFDKLQCGPRALMILAEKISQPIEPDALWERFSEELGNSSGKVSASLVLDMARAFCLAKHLDVTHDVDRVGRVLDASNVAGVMLAWERCRTQVGDATFYPHHHIVIVHQILIDKNQKQYLDIESPQLGRASERFSLPVELLPMMMSSFLILYN
jgi:hypothetical protein